MLTSSYSNLSSSDLISIKKSLTHSSGKKNKKSKNIKSYSNEKIKQQSYEINKLNQKVLEIENRVLTMNTTNMAPNKTIIKIKESPIRP